MGKTVSSFYNSALDGDYVDVIWHLEDLSRSPSDIGRGTSMTSNDHDRIFLYRNEVGWM